MAMTFRDFFRGIAEVTPVLADTLYKQALWRQETEFKERELGMKERQVTAQEKESEASVEASRAQTALSDYERENLVPLKIRAEETNQKIADLSLLMEQGKFDAMENYEGGITGYMRDTIQLPIDKMKADLKNAEANLASSEAQKIYYDLQAQVARAETLSKGMFTAMSMATDPKAQQWVTENLSKFTDTNTGTINFGALMAEAATADARLMSPELRQAFIDISSNADKAVKDYELGVTQFIMQKVDTIIGDRKLRSRYGVSASPSNDEYNNLYKRVESEFLNTSTYRKLQQQASHVNNLLGFENPFVIPPEGFMQNPPPPLNAPPSSLGKIFSDPAPFGPQAREGFQEIGQGVKNIYGGATQEPGGDPYRYGRF